MAIKTATSAVLLLATLASAFLQNGAQRQGEDGIYRFKLKRSHALTSDGQLIDLKDHPHLEVADSGHPILRDWSHAEMFDQLVKEPMTNISNLIYTMTCSAGTPLNSGDSEQEFVCVMDTSTAISSVFSKDFNDYSTSRFNTAQSSTYQQLDGSKEYPFWSIGLKWNGIPSSDRYCIGSDDVHVNVCLDDFFFMLITSEVDKKQHMWDPSVVIAPAEKFAMIIGLGVPNLVTKSQDAEYSFVEQAYQQGDLKNNLFVFEAVDSWLEQYAHLTIGGYQDADFASSIAWYDNFETNDAISSEWGLPISEFYLSDGVTQTLLNGDGIQMYGYFNSGYPFIGMSEDIANKVRDIVVDKYPSFNCEGGVYKRYFGICLRQSSCADVTFEEKFTIKFGTDALIEIPLTSLVTQIYYDFKDYCMVAIQPIDNFDTLFPDTYTTESRVYFGDAFFKNVAGIFDIENKQFGLALSHYAVGPTKVCPTGDCSVEPEAPYADVDPYTDDPDDQGSDVEPDGPSQGGGGGSGGSGSTSLMWLWMLIAALLIIILVLAVLYAKKKNDERKQVSAIAYGPGHSGDMIESDVGKDTSGKGDNRYNHFADHAALVRETFSKNAIPEEYADLNAEITEEGEMEEAPALNDSETPGQPVSTTPGGPVFDDE